MAADVISFLSTASDQVGILSKKLERLRSKGGQLKLAVEFRKIADAMKAMGTGLKSADMEKQMKTISDSFKKSSKLIENETKNSGKRRVNISKDLNKQIELSETSSYKRRIDRLSSFTGQAIQFFKMQMLWYPTKALSFKVLAIPGDIIRSTAEYGDALLQVSSVARLLPGQLAELDSEIQKTAANTKFSITELGEATKQLAQAGFQKDEIKSAIQPIALLATATASSVQSSTDLIATIVRAYGKSASDIGNITDTLAAAVTKSRLTIDKLNDAFNYVASASAQAGVAFEDTTAMLGVLANSGMKMTTAATGLRMSFLKLLAPTAKASSELKKFGLTDDDVNLTKHNIYDVLKTIQSLPIDSVIKIFSARSATAILALNNVGVEGIQLMRKAMDANGLAATMAAEQLLGLKQSWKNLLDVIVSTEYKFGKVFGDELALNIRTVKSYFIDLGNAIEDSNSGIHTFFTWTGRLIGLLATFSIAKAFGGGLFVTETTLELSKALGSVNKLKKAWLMLQAAVKGTSVAAVSETVALKVAAEGAEESILAARLSLVSLINPWTVGIAAILSLTGYLVKHYYDLRKASEKLISDTAKYNVEITKIKGNLYDIQAKGVKLEIIKKEDADFADKYLESLKSQLLDQISLAKDSAKAIGASFNLAQYEELSKQIKEFTGNDKGSFSTLTEKVQTFLATLEHTSAIKKFVSELRELAEAQRAAAASSNQKAEAEGRFYDSQSPSLLYNTNTGSTFEGGVPVYDSLDAVNEFQTAIAKYKTVAGATLKQAYDSLSIEAQEYVKFLAEKTGKSLEVFLQQSFNVTQEQLKKNITESVALVKEAMGHFNEEITKVGKIHAWSTSEKNTLVSALDRRLAELKAQGKEAEPVYKEIKEKRDKAIEGLIKAPDEAKLNKIATEAATVIKAAQKNVLEGIVGSNTANEAASTFGNLVDDKFFDQVTEIENKIAKMKGTDFDTSGLERQVAEMYKAYYGTFDKIEAKGVKATKAIHKQFLKLTKDALEVAKANGDVDGTIEALTVKYEALDQVIDDQIITLELQKIKEGGVNKEIEKNIKLLKSQQKQLKIKEAIEKLKAKSEPIQKELEAQEEIYKILGKVYQARQIEIAVYQEKINLINDELTKVTGITPEVEKRLNKEKALLEIKKEQLEHEEKESSAIEGFTDQIKKLGEEYKHIGLSYNDGMKLANDLNDKFASSIEDNFMALVEGTKSFTQAFKDSFKTILHDFYAMVMRMVAQKIVVPVVMNAVGGVVSGVASMTGMTGAATSGAASGGLSWSGGGLQAVGDWYMSGMGGTQGAFASGLQDMGLGTTMTANVGAGAGPGYTTAGTGAAGTVQNMSPQAWGGVFSGVTTAIITGLQTGNWGYAAAKGLGVGGGAYAGGQLGAMTGNPIIAAVGAIIGGILGGLGIDKLFGGGKKPSWEYDVRAGMTFEDGVAIAKKTGWSDALNLAGGLTNEELTAKASGGDYFGDFTRSWGKHDKGQLGELATSAGKALDEGVGTILKTWGDWVNGMANSMPTKMSSEFTDALNSIDFNWSYREDDKSPNEDSVKENIETILNNLTDSLWETYKDAVTSFSEEFYKYSFDKIDIQITEPLIDVNASFEEFQTQAQNVYDRINALTALSVSLGETEGPTVFEQQLASLNQQFDALEASLIEKEATTAELVKLDDLEDVALGQMMASLALSSNSMSDFAGSVEELSKYLEDAGTTTEEFARILSSFEKSLGKTIKAIYESHHPTSGVDEAEMYLAGFGYQYTPESWDEITGKLVDSWKASAAYQVDQVDFGSWLVGQLQANGFDEGTALQIATAWGKVGNAGVSAVDRINKGFSDLLISFQSRISAVFDPLISIDQMIKDAEGTDYLFGDLTKKANTEEEMFQWAISTSNAEAGRQYGLALANTLKELDPLSSNLDYVGELKWIREEMNKLESPEDLQQSILSEAKAYYTNSLSYLDGILKALNTFQPDVKLKIEMPSMVEASIITDESEASKKPSAVGNGSFNHYTEPTNTPMTFFKSILPAGSFK